MAYLPQLEIIFQDEFLRIGWNDTIKFIYLEWLQHPISEAFRPRFEKAVDLSKARKSQYWLSDSQAIHYLEFADQNWLMNEVGSLIYESHIKKFARITTIESFSLVDIRRIYDQIKGNSSGKIKTEFEEFLDKQDAFNWILSDVDSSVFPV